MEFLIFRPRRAYCHTACTLLSVSIVGGRPLDFRVEQTVDLDADYRLPYQFHRPGRAAGHANFAVSRQRNRICKFIGEEKKRNRGYVRLLDSTRNSLRFMNYDRSVNTLLLYPGRQRSLPLDFLELFNRISPPVIYKSASMFIKLLLSLPVSLLCTFVFEKSVYRHSALFLVDNKGLDYSRTMRLARVRILSDLL